MLMWILALLALGPIVFAIGMGLSEHFANKNKPIGTPGIIKPSKSLSVISIILVFAALMIAGLLFGGKGGGEYPDIRTDFRGR